MCRSLRCGSPPPLPNLPQRCCPPADVFRWPEVGWTDLVPYQDFKHNHEYYYQVGTSKGATGGRQGPANERARSCSDAAAAQWAPPALPPQPQARLARLQVPEDPVGAVFLAHGCVHSAYNYWPQSEACPECRGLPEELSHTLQALKLGYAGRCWRAAGAGGGAQRRGGQGQEEARAASAGRGGLRRCGSEHNPALPMCPQSLPSPPRTVRLDAGLSGTTASTFRKLSMRGAETGGARAAAGCLEGPPWSVW